MDLARVKDVNAIRDANARNVEMLAKASERSHQAIMKFVGDALAGVDSRMEADNEWHAALFASNTEQVRRLTARIHALEHPWKVRRARFVLWYYKRELALWNWFDRTWNGEKRS